MKDDLFQSEAWSLQNDFIIIGHIRTHVASIRHHCIGKESGHTIWFNEKGSITMCYCGAVVPDEIQGLCVLYNMDLLMETKI